MDKKTTSVNENDLPKSNSSHQKAGDPNLIKYLEFMHNLKSQNPTTSVNTNNNLNQINQFNNQFIQNQNVSHSKAPNMLNFNNNSQKTINSSQTGFPINSQLNSNFNPAQFNVISNLNLQNPRQNAGFLNLPQNMNFPNQLHLLNTINQNLSQNVGIKPNPSFNCFPQSLFNSQIGNQLGNPIGNLIGNIGNSNSSQMTNIIGNNLGLQSLLSGFQNPMNISNFSQKKNNNNQNNINQKNNNNGVNNNTTQINNLLKNNLLRMNTNPNLLQNNNQNIFNQANHPYLQNEAQSTAMNILNSLSNLNNNLTNCSNSINKSHITNNIGANGTDILNVPNNKDSIFNSKEVINDNKPLDQQTEEIKKEDKMEVDEPILNHNNAPLGTIEGKVEINNNEVPSQNLANAKVLDSRDKVIKGENQVDYENINKDSCNEDEKDQMEDSIFNEYKENSLKDEVEEVSEVEKERNTLNKDINPKDLTFAASNMNLLNNDCINFRNYIGDLNTNDKLGDNRNSTTNITNIVMNFEKINSPANYYMSSVLEDLKKQIYSIQYYSLLQKLFINYIFKNLQDFVDDLNKPNQINNVPNNQSLDFSQLKQMPLPGEGSFDSKFIDDIKNFTNNIIKKTEEDNNPTNNPTNNLIHSTNNTDNNINNATSINHIANNLANNDKKDSKESSKQLLDSMSNSLDAQNLINMQNISNLINSLQPNIQSMSNLMNMPNVSNLSEMLNLFRNNLSNIPQNINMNNIMNSMNNIPNLLNIPGLQNSPNTTNITNITNLPNVTNISNISNISTNPTNHLNNNHLSNLNNMNNPSMSNNNVISNLFNKFQLPNTLMPNMSNILNLLANNSNSNKVNSSGNIDFEKLIKTMNTSINQTNTNSSNSYIKPQLFNQQNNLSNSFNNQNSNSNLQNLLQMIQPKNTTQTNSFASFNSNYQNLNNVYLGQDGLSNLYKDSQKSIIEACLKMNNVQSGGDQSRSQNIDATNSFSNLQPNNLFNQRVIESKLNSVIFIDSQLSDLFQNTKSEEKEKIGFGNSTINFINENTSDNRKK